MGLDHRLGIQIDKIVFAQTLVLKNPFFNSTGVRAQEMQTCTYDNN